jgi:hypothetical protein
MKIDGFYRSKIFGALLVCFLSAAAAGAVFSQSGRPAASPDPETPLTAEIVKTPAPCEKGLPDQIYISPRSITAFFGELNRLGGCGYRLEKAGKLPLEREAASALAMIVFGVVKLEAGNKYEYRGVEAFGDWQTASRIGDLAKEGFYFRKNLLFQAGACNEGSGGGADDSTSVLVDILGLGRISRGSIFIVERKNGIRKNIEYLAVKGAAGDSQKDVAENQKLFEAAVAKGFRPVAINYMGIFVQDFAVLMEKDPEIKAAGEYRLLRHIYGISKKFAELGQEGYEPILVGVNFAVLQRKNSDPTGVFYQTTDEFDTTVKKLPSWRGAHYQVTGLADYHVGCDPYEGKLFFALPLNEAAGGYEYKILAMTNVKERLKKKEKTAAFTDSPTAEALNEFQKILQEGYTVKDIFFAGEVTFYFERAKK